MLINASRLIGRPVLSLHIGGELARISELIINPHKLNLLAVRVDGPLVGTEDAPGEFVPVSSIREFSRIGIIIDSADELVEAGDIVELQEVLSLHFELTGLKVVTKNKAKLGKVSDFVLETSLWNVEQLIVQRPAIKSLLDPELIISRSHILEVDDYKVVVKSEHETAKPAVKKAKEFVPNFVNPFREPDFVSPLSPTDSQTPAAPDTE